MTGLEESCTLGDIVPPQPRTYARHAVLDEQGKVVPIMPDPIQLDVYRYVLKDGQPTGYVKRERMRTLDEVYADLYAALMIAVCDKCGAERKLKDGRRGEDWAGDEHKKCGGTYKVLIDEYMSGPHCEWWKGESRDVPKDYRGVACYAVTGGSEGHYVHCEFYSDVEVVKVSSYEYSSCDFGEAKKVRPIAGHRLQTITRLALIKTFRGMEHAQALAARCAKLLGA